MKIRNGFVSNSSSSSFVCDICGCVAEGYDMSIQEAQMVECENRHTFCLEHNKELSEEIYDNENQENGYMIDKINCPICTMKEFRLNDILSYFLKYTGKTKQEIMQEIKERFKDFNEFKTYINN